MQLSNLSLALTAIYGSGFAWRRLITESGDTLITESGDQLRT